MEYGNMLAITGSPGSGKTTVGVRLAAELAKCRKNVIVVCADPFVPSVPFLLPVNAEHQISLGELLTAPAVSQNRILRACVPVSSNEYVSLLGYRMGENLMSYPKITRDRVVEFLVCLRHLADYVILDCTSVIEADIFSILSMEVADRILQIGTSNLRGISHYQSHVGLLQEHVRGKLLRAIGNFRIGQEWEAVAGQYGGVSFVFPYVTELERRYDEASLLEPLTSKDAAPFIHEVKKLMTEVFGVGDMKRKKSEEEKGISKKKLVVRSPIAWKSRGEF
ncbi:MAG: hypothetical protein HFI35_16550 [Roseburia sp.]|jgi:hypothetical protein|nr:hypothetical protein [Roseburia sp.]